MTAFVELTALVVAPVIIGLFFIFIERERERSRELTDLYARYFSPELIAARRQVWDFYTTTWEPSPKPWSVFLVHDPDEDRTQYRDAREQINLVGSTLALLGVLLDERRVDRALAKRLFGWQWLGWTAMFHEIKQCSIDNDDRYPGWFELLDVLDQHLLDRDELLAAWSGKNRSDP